MDLKAALSRYVRELDQPVITDYDLSMAVVHLYGAKKYRGEALDLTDPFPSWQKAFATFVQPLIDLGILTAHKDFPEGRVFTITGNRYQEPGDIACSVDPFAYVSHLSAMEYHGLTNRFPKLLYLSAPRPRSGRPLPVKRWKRKDGGCSPRIRRTNCRVWSIFPSTRFTRPRSPAMRASIAEPSRISKGESSGFRPSAGPFSTCCGGRTTAAACGMSWRSTDPRRPSTGPHHRRIGTARQCHREGPGRLSAGGARPHPG